MASSRNSRVSPSPRPGSSGTVLSREDELEMDKITNEDPSPRPVSSASRQAWKDNEGFDMASEEPDNYDEQDGSSDEDEDGDHAPTAMESEVYMGTDMKAMDLKTARAKEDHARAGLCRKIMRGIRCKYNSKFLFLGWWTLGIYPQETIGSSPRLTITLLTYLGLTGPNVILATALYSITAILPMHRSPIGLPVPVQIS
ncbi:putative polycystic kidney disease protein 2 [Apostichopus japonicus]|uniref:Putative polycystic kidney disease protein 2 n=1 Tax=Stichopus japonicus TaxID=307972 RepID=A0A2G8JLN4_STIJA|nr:putative polycystic kidney disease protein 2 [Apostichopus japonicus]WDP79917.1 polycystic kidney disease 2 protein 2 [Apostichopus japonicus]